MDGLVNFECNFVISSMWPLNRHVPRGRKTCTMSKRHHLRRLGSWEASCYGGISQLAILGHVVITAGVRLPGELGILKLASTSSPQESLFSKRFLLLDICSPSFSYASWSLLSWRMPLTSISSLATFVTVQLKIDWIWDTFGEITKTSKHTNELNTIHVLSRWESSPFAIMVYEMIHSHYIYIMWSTISMGLKFTSNTRYKTSFSRIWLNLRF